MPKNSDPNSSLITLRVPRKMAEAVAKIAKEDGETQSAIFRRLLRQGLQQSEATKGK